MGHAQGGVSCPPTIGDVVLSSASLSAGAEHPASIIIAAITPAAPKENPWTSKTSAAAGVIASLFMKVEARRAQIGSHADEAESAADSSANARSG